MVSLVLATWAAVSVHGGGVKHAVAGSFAAPDILTNMSFEAGWDGWSQALGGGGDPPCASPTEYWTRATDQANSGTVSARAHWEPGQASSGGCDRYMQRNLGGGYDGIYLRAYVRFSAILTMSTGSFMKLMATWSSDLTDRLGILSFKDPGVRMIMFDASNVEFVIWTPSIDTWYQLEVQFAHNGFDTPQARMWVDGTQITKANGTEEAGGVYTWQDGWVVSATRTNSKQIGALGLSEQIGGEAQTNSGYVWWDDVAVSTQRIGP